MQDLKPIRVFLEVATQKSFSAAAQNLRMTPASVTRIVARLEENLGHQLLLRTTRQVSLSSTGAIIAARYRPVIEEFDRVTQELDRLTKPDRGTLSINVPMSFGMRLMPKLIESYQLAYPNVALNLNFNDSLIDILAEQCDLALRVSQPPTDKSMIWRKICEIPRQLVVSPKLLVNYDLPSDPQDLNQQLCLSYTDKGSAETWQFRSSGSQRKVNAGTQIASNNGDFLYSAVCNGSGLAVLPDFIVADGIRSGDVLRALPDWTCPPLVLGLYYPPYSALPPLVSSFTDFVEAFLRDQNGFDFS
ncbi:LysR family transcriptional regulator [Aestuariibius sp. HNIBRBA575]|uniref:LysR family transcriptional regulator n=1 Tax=Aestuariibius sp. HNIBRBA575 TaxID=3233343 RepID=UPI0034A3EF4E